MSGIAGLDSRESVVCAGEKKSAGAERREACVGDLVWKRDPCCIWKVLGESFGQDLGFRLSESGWNPQIGTMGEVGGFDDIVIDEKDRADAEEAE
jgi:hypothetical protein